MKLSALPTVNQLVLSLDRYDQAIADINAGKLEVIIASQKLVGEALIPCRDHLLIEMRKGRARVLREIDACGVQVD